VLVGHLEARQKNGEAFPEEDLPPGAASLSVVVNLPALV
jgi:hypothetical protein